jgi:hypothetical protein
MQLRDVIEPEEEDPKAKFHRAAQDRVDLYGADTRRLIAIIVDFEDATVCTIRDACFFERRRAFSADRDVRF